VYRSSAASLLHLGDRARKDSVERGRPFAHSVRAALDVYWRRRSLERSSGGGEAAAQALDERNHPFEVGTVLWVRAALLLYRGIRAKEVPHRFERAVTSATKEQVRPSTLSAAAT
jgi:hypothetical protein